MVCADASCRHGEAYFLKINFSKMDSNEQIGCMPTATAVLLDEKDYVRASWGAACCAPTHELTTRYFDGDWVADSSWAICFLTKSALGPGGRYLTAIRRCSRAPGKSCLLARITARSCSAFGSVCCGSAAIAFLTLSSAASVLPSFILATAL